MKTEVGQGASNPEERRMYEAQKKRWEREREREGQEKPSNPSNPSDPSYPPPSSIVSPLALEKPILQQSPPPRLVDGSKLAILVSATLKAALTLDGTAEAWEMVRAASDVLESMVEASMKSKIEQAARSLQQQFEQGQSELSGK